ncbi:tetratricopeptide repeat protein [Archangium primigenium]|uniref:tetratricopeptide repeat protein n=1 Tax=[Archangium] primigenium TaxID=2792470 RepID=UPI00195A6836|nr:tetratricopeptide repeat protein [Archangium primigenium]MBM7115670.1 tetratricopeptide repeat protein [Archangium primigenium]
MSRSSRPTVRRLVAALVVAQSLGGGAALAQYRPPPMTEAQRLVREGETAQVDASSAATSGDKKRAEARYRKALELFEKALAEEPTSVAAAAGVGAVGLALQEHERVAALVTPVYAARSDALELAYPLGIALFKLKRYDEAVPVLRQVSAANQPEHLLVHYYLGNYYALLSQQGDEAVAELQTYLALRPEKIAGNDFQIHELLGRGHLLRNDPAAARLSFERAQVGRPESVSLQMGLGAALELEGRMAEALTLLEGLTRRFPRVPEVRERLGRLLLESNDLPGADAQTKALVALGATASAHLLQGDVRMAQGRPAEAETEYREVLRQLPNDVGAQISVGMALQRQGRNEEAIAFLEGAVQSGANSLELWSTLGSVNRRAGRYARAVEVHRRVVEMAPQRALGHVLLGADHFATGQWDLTIDDYAQALKLEPDHAGAKKWLGRALAHRARDRAGGGRVDDAVRDLRRAFDLERSSAMARRLGAALLQQGSHAEARKVMEQGVQLPEAAWRDHLLLGYARLGAGAPKEALAAFEQAGKMAPDSASLSDVSAGSALAELELGQVDAALKRLNEPGASKRATEVARANLSRAHLRRAFARLEAGDGVGARQDVEAAERAGLGGGTSELGRLGTFSKALAQAEEGRFADASAGLKRALTPLPDWARPNTRQLADAFVLYLKDALPQSRRMLTLATKRPIPEQSQWTAHFTSALHRREAERAYASGNMRAADKALKAALALAPDSLALQHNLACVAYRSNKTAEAVAVWHRLEGSLPQATLNLGIDAQERRHNVGEAVDAYRRYLAASPGARTAAVREWKDRLQMIYGMNDAAAPATAPSSATASDTTP